MRRSVFLLLAGLCLLAAPSAHAASPSLTYRYRHFLFTVRPASSWRTTERQWTYLGRPFVPPQELLVDGDDIPPLPPGVLVTGKDGWNRGVIRDALAAQIAQQLHRDAGSVVISRSASGGIVFDGVGLTGRDVDLEKATTLTVTALENGVTDIVLPVIEIQPHIQVNDPKLLKQGIKEVVTVGESDFSNSPQNRLHNIATGLGKFNGVVIPQNAVFSFDQTLGRVDGTTGYLKELVIKGDKTMPDYGGGLCQVSTTAYRGVWEYGFPIVQRINHSYMVSHYSPQGTDATVYPPNVDMKFQNDSPGSLLIQTYEKGNLAYFIFYGTRDARRSSIIGPFNWDSVPPPPDRIEYVLPNDEVALDQHKKVGERVPGMKTLWYRFVQKEKNPEQMETVYSFYEARPHYELIGVAQLPSSGSGDALPTMFTEDQTAASAASQDSEN